MNIGSDLGINRVERIKVAEQNAIKGKKCAARSKCHEKATGQGGP